jgi:hypothetical protein
MKTKMKLSVVVLSFICVVLLITPGCSAGLSSLSLKKKSVQSLGTAQSQYWALLFAVGTYEKPYAEMYGQEDKNRTSMLDACDDLYSVLLDSPQFWQASNIHVQKEEQCYLKNLINELLWLRENARSEDYVFVYITTHGSYLTRNGLPWDLPPKDETDGKDEFLFMYNGFHDVYGGKVWDDLLNFFLSIIKCQALCLIVDSCYSGGFNDAPVPIMKQKRYTATSCQENELSYGSDFSNLIITGLTNGFADTNIWLFGTSGNNDGVVSAQEAFRFAQFWFGGQNPTERDLFGSEFPLTY